MNKLVILSANILIKYNREVKIVNIGIVLQVGDDIACIYEFDEYIDI